MIKFILLLLAFLIVAFVIRGPDIQNAVLILLRDDNVLLVKDKYNGEWQFPGGMIDSTDASPLDAALREFREETDHTLSDYKIINTLDYRHTRLFIATSNDQIYDSQLNNNEMDERRWYNIQNMPKLRQSNENSFSIIKKLIVRD